MNEQIFRNVVLLEPSHTTLLARGEFPILFLITIGLIAAVIVVTMWMRSRNAHLLMNLKKSMVERGMSVDEIERVLVAGTGSKARLPRQSDVLPPTKPAGGPINWPSQSRT
jgi:hypothetical protein